MNEESTVQSFSFDVRLMVLIRGAPGVGKSSCAALLGESGAASCVVEVDQFRAFIPSVDWSDRHLHRLARDTATDAATAFAIGGFSPVMLVDCFGRDHAEQAVRRATAVGITTMVVSLWADSDTLRTRLGSRQGSAMADFEMAVAINEDIRMHRVDDHLIDTTKLDAITVGRRVRALMEASR